MKKQQGGYPLTDEDLEKMVEFICGDFKPVEFRIQPVGKDGASLYFKDKDGSKLEAGLSNVPQGWTERITQRLKDKLHLP